MKMTANQYRKALDKLGLSQLAAGKLFGVGARTSRRWALGENEDGIPVAVCILLQAMLDKKLRLQVPVLQEGTRNMLTFTVDLSAKTTVSDHV
jgi:hypothetical protein